jgi:hypothetical protein
LKLSDKNSHFLFEHRIGIVGFNRGIEYRASALLENAFGNSIYFCVGQQAVPVSRSFTNLLINILADLMPVIFKDRLSNLFFISEVAINGAFT